MPSVRPVPPSAFLAAAFALLAAGCGEAPQRSRETGAPLFERPFSSAVVNASGERIGTVSGTPGNEGVAVRVEAERLPPGDHGLHLHEAGRCDPPDFASGGGHWNGQGRKHGHDNPAGPHDGDWGNLTAGADGKGAADRLIPRYHGKIPAAGLAVVIHAGADDERTDPSGNSGGRIACGVVLAPER